MKRRIWGKTGLVLALSAALLLAALIAVRSGAMRVEPVSNLVFDTYQTIKPRESSDSIVVIADIDEHSIAKLGQWPWPRTVMAELTRRLADAGVLAIGYDLVFSEPDRTSPGTVAAMLAESAGNAELGQALARLPDHDKAFANAIARAPVALGFFDGGTDGGNDPLRIAGIAWAGDEASRLLHRPGAAIASLPALQGAASGSGTISLGPQGDDIIREVPMFVTTDQGVFPSLSIEALRVAIGAATGSRQSFIIKSTSSGTEVSAGVDAITEARVANFIFPLTADGALRMHYARHDPSRILSIAGILEADPSALRSRLEGTIVLVGTSAVGLRDIRVTALREAVPGVTIHAQIIDQIMQGSFLSRPDWAPGAEWLLAAISGLAIIMLSPLIGPVLSAAAGAIGALAVAAASWYAYSAHGLLIDPVLPVLLTLATYVLTTVLLYAFAEGERRFVRTAFQRYLAPDVLTRLEENPEALKLGGEIRDMTILFMDVRDFTPISEQLDPEELVTFLNTLLSPLSAIIQRHEGAIDKYIGDSIMAFWNAPLDVEDHPHKACLAALEMLSEVERMNREDRFGFTARGLPPVAIAIGINTGTACVGNLGSAERFDYSVVGDAVNVAARLESATRTVDWPILVSAATAERSVDLALLPAGTLELKGKREAQPVFALAGDETMAADPSFAALRNGLESLPPTTARKQRGQKIRDCISLAPPHLHSFLKTLA